MRPEVLSKRKKVKWRGRGHKLSARDNDISAGFARFARLHCNLGFLYPIGVPSANASVLVIKIDFVQCLIVEIAKVYIRIFYKIRMKCRGICNKFAVLMDVLITEILNF
jgi:hypothetical protein